MPKILEDARDKLIAVARRQALNGGYQHMTIRSVAQECGYSVGTVYNYFKSKEMLVAAFMLTDWQEEIEEMQELSANASPEEAVKILYEGLSRFGALYATVFEDRNAQRSYAMQDRSYHTRLVEQLTAILEEVYKRNGREYTPLLLGFLTEALVMWSGRKCPYEDLADILNKIL